MKKRSGVYLFLSILEGMLSGGYFYLARREREPLNLLTGAVWLACSVFHGLLSLQEPEDGVIFLTEDKEDE